MTRSLAAGRGGDLMVFALGDLRRNGWSAGPEVLPGFALGAAETRPFCRTPPGRTDRFSGGTKPAFERRLCQISAISRLTGFEHLAELFALWTAQVRDQAGVPSAARQSLSGC